MKNLIRFWKFRLHPYLLAGVLLVTTVLTGWVPRIWAAGLVSAVDEGTTFPANYAYSFRFTGKTVTEPFGMDDLLHDYFDPRGSRKFIVQELKNDSQKGKVGMRYTQVGKYYGKNLDLEITLEDWGKLFDNCYERESGTKIKPSVLFYTDTIKIALIAAEKARFRFTFYEHGTRKAVVVPGHATLSDLDDTQKFGFGQGDGIEAVHILKGNSHLKVKGDTIESADALTTPGEKKGWSTVFFDKSFSLEFYTAVKTHNQDRIQLPRDDKGYLMPGVFEFTAYALGDFAISDVLEKRVGKPKAAWEKADAASEEAPFIFEEYDSFSYQIRHSITPNHLKVYELRDQVDSCLILEGAHKVKITNQYGTDVTGKFQITVAGQEVKCAAKAAELAKESFTNNETYTFRIEVRRRKDAALEASHFPRGGDGFTFQFSNTASLKWERTTQGSKSIVSNTVWVRSRQLADIAVEKRAAYEWEKGDIVDYHVVAQQIRPHSWAVNFRMEDISLPQGLELLGNAAAGGAEGIVLKNTKENGWQLTCPRLDYGKVIVVAFQCRVTEDFGGQEILNTVTAAADNYLDISGQEPRAARDSQDIWINSPRLWVEKTAERFEWQEGEAVSYEILVNNTSPNSIARKVVLSDLDIPDSLELQQEEGIQVEGVKEQILYPIADKKTGVSYKTIENQARLEQIENGWEVHLDYLPAQMPVRVRFACIARETSNGQEWQNQVKAEAENAEAVWDDARVYINTAGFQIEKTASHYEWMVGEAVEYTVKVKNVIPKTIAREVVISDMELPVGLELLNEELLIEGIPERISQPVSDKEDIPNEQNPENYGKTEEIPVDWDLYKEEGGWKLMISHLPAEEEVSITFYCGVTEEANGTQRVNNASVSASNGQLREEDERVYINTPVLSIEKTAERENSSINDSRLPYEFRVGETVEYQVVVENRKPGTIARELIISDLTLPPGMVLLEGEDCITWEGIWDTFENPVSLEAKNEGEELLSYIEVEEKEITRELRLEQSGWELYISDLPFNMTVTIRYRCVIQEEINGMEVINTATAQAGNAKEVESTAVIWVNSPVLQVEKTPDKKSYKYGDIATYRIEILQKQTGCVARNIMVEDLLREEGMELQKNSIVLLDRNGKKLEAEVQVTGNNFAIETKRNLVKEEYYKVYDKKQGGILEQSFLNPLKEEEEAALIVEYQVAVAEETLAGKEVVNKVLVNSQEDIPAEDEANTKIHGPILSLEKQSDKMVYEVGEKGYYKLTIRQLREDVTAHGITIEDCFQEMGMTIVGDSLKLRFNGQTRSGVKFQMKKNGFTIDTDWNLSDRDKLEIFYQVVFDSEELTGQGLVNTARARAVDAPEIFQEQEVLVQKKEEPGKIPEVSPSNTPLPQETVKATPKMTPDPSKALSGSYGRGRFVKTGDTSPLLLFFLLFAGGFFTTIILTVRRIRRNQKVYRGLFQ